MTNTNIYAIIPARGGSKGIPGKNIKPFAGKPLIAWSIQQALECKYIDRVIVSTDSQEIADIAITWGAEVPFLRPVDISGDLSTDLEFMQHCLTWLQESEGIIPDMVVQLRPTYPGRKLSILNDCMTRFIDSDYDSLRTVIPIEKSPYKMYHVNGDNLVPLFREVNGLSEPYNRCRQELPQAYLHNGYIDIIKSDVILDQASMTGDKIYAYVMRAGEYHDIDTLDDWVEAEKIILN